MRAWGSFQVGSVVYVQAMAAFDRYEDGLMLVVNEGKDELRPVEEGTEGLQLVASLDTDRIKALTEELYELIASVRDVPLKMLLQAFFSDRTMLDAFKYSPSAIRHHHAYVGGNLEHTVGVARVVDLLAARYPRIDRDLAITGALLHDIGKLKEYRVAASVEMTSEGQFIGHSQLGWEMIRERLDRVPGLTEERRLKLWDMVVHHHGSYERDSDMASNIHTLESCALHYADDTDAKVGAFAQLLRQAGEAKDEWVFAKDLGFSIYTR
jgi:3'-5' exoribonuclease